MPWNKPYKPYRNQRLDPELYEQSNRVCFFTIRAFENKSPFVTDTMNRLVIETLSGVQDTFKSKVYTYCLMPDHLHFLASPILDGISILKFAEGFKGKSTNLSWKLGWEGKLWQPRYYDHIVRTEESLSEIVQYIMNNPVRKGLVEKAEDWPWSGQMNERNFS